jgi:PAS domain S-box-containing protein
MYKKEKIKNNVSAAGIVEFLEDGLITFCNSYYQDLLNDKACDILNENIFLRSNKLKDRIIFNKETLPPIGTSLVIKQPIRNKKTSHIEWNIVHVRGNNCKSIKYQAIGKIVNKSEKTKIDIEQRFHLHRELVSHFNETHNIQDIYNLIYSELPIKLNVSRVSLLLYDEGTNSLYSETAIGKDKPEIFSQPIGYSISGICFKEKRVVVINDCRKTDLIPQNYVDQLRLKSTLAIPLIYKDKTIGVLRVDDSKKYHRFSDEDVEFLSILTDQIAIMTENARLIESLIEAEKQLKYNINFLEEIIEAMPNPVYIIDINGIFLSCNKEFESFTGLSRSLIVNKEPIKIFTPSQAEVIIRKNSRLFLEEMQTSYEGQISFQSNDPKNIIIYKGTLKTAEKKIIGIVGVIVDITVSKKKEEQVKISELKYKQLFNEAPIGYHEVNREGIIIDVNATVEKLLGYKKQEIIGKSFLEYIPKESRTNAESIFTKKLNKNLSVTGFERKYLDSEGKVVYCYVEDKLLTNESGDVEGIRSSLINITQYKSMEEALRTSEERLNSLYNLSQMTSLANHEIINYSLEEIIHLTQSGISYLHQINDNSINLNPAGFSQDYFKVEKSLADKHISLKHLREIWEMCSLHKKPLIVNGFKSALEYEEKNIEIINYIVIPIIEDDKVSAFAGVCNKCNNYSDWDLVQVELFVSEMWKIIARKKNSEELIKEKENLKVTLNSIRDGVISTDSFDNIVNMNNALEEILGYNKAEIIGKDIEELFLKIQIELQDDGVSLSTKKIVNNLKTLTSFEEKNRKYKITSKDNEHKIISCVASPISHGTKTMIGYVYVIRDLTQTIKLEQHLSLSQKLESIGQLAAGIAHEINTPMQYINDNTKFLDDSFSNLLGFITAVKSNIYPKVAEDKELSKMLDNYNDEYDINYLSKEISIALKQTEEGIDKVNKIILAMKDFSHHKNKEKILADINHSIEVTATITKNAWKYVADLELDLDKELPMILCIVDELNQVFLNMIINSVHAIEEVKNVNPAHNGKIIIKTIFEDGYVIIKISDNGNGIENTHINKIFDPFFTTKKIGKGTGQGLSIAHDIVVNKHSGNLFVESQLGIGTTFTIRLPINNEEKN